MQHLSYKDFAGPEPARLIYPNQRTLMNNSDPQMNPSTNEPFAALVGLDWAEARRFGLVPLGMADETAPAAASRRVSCAGR